MNPYLVLDLTVDAGDAEVRAAYQSLLRRYPPEQRPEEFQAVQEAYTALRTSRDRWHYRLLHFDDGGAWGPLEAVEQFARLPGRMKPPGAKAFQSLLHSCAADVRRG